MAVSSCVSEIKVDVDNQDGWNLVQDRTRAPMTMERKAPNKVSVSTGEAPAWLEIKTRWAGNSMGIFAPKEMMIDLLRANPNGGVQTTTVMDRGPGHPGNIQLTTVSNERQGELLRGNRYQVFTRTDADGNEQARVQNRRGAVVFTMTDAVEDFDAPRQWTTPACPDGE
jgi:hypothetical protein